MQSHSWQERAACRAHPTETFFDRAGNVHSRITADTSLRRWRAKQICAACPVAVECLRHAENAGAEFGVYGGLDQKERAAVRSGNPNHGQIADLIRRLRKDGLSYRRIADLMRFNQDQVEYLHDHYASTTGGRLGLAEYLAWNDVAEGFAPMTISKRHSLPIDRAETMCEAMDKESWYVGPRGDDRRVGRTASVAH